MNFYIENEDAFLKEELEEVKTKIKDAIENWRGEDYDDWAGEYRGEIRIGFKVFSFHLEAKLDENGIMNFSDEITIKRIR